MRVMLRTALGTVEHVEAGIPGETIVLRHLPLETPPKVRHDYTFTYTHDDHDGMPWYELTAVTQVRVRERRKVEPSTDGG